MNYEDFLKEIYIRHSTNVKLGLERMYALLEKMGYPNQKLQGIHVAGTNGKGSVCATLESLLRSYGFSTGLNTSPHLIDYTERFRINGENITPDELMSLYSRYEHLFAETEASFFEITTALAFALFVEKKIHSSIIEVGLGGRLDGTNPFNSTVTVITSISLDHPKSLGDTIPMIAYEKAGIIKSGIPVVIGSMPNEARNEILKVAHSKNAPTYIIDNDFFIKNITLSVEATYFDYSFPKYNIHLENLSTNLLGRHQAHNVALALTAFFIYLSVERTASHTVGTAFMPSETERTAFIPSETERTVFIPSETERTAFMPSETERTAFIPSETERTALMPSLRSINWFGRLQVLNRDPLIVIDGAHNEEGVSTLIENILEMFPDRKYHFLVAILRDKRLDNMIREICKIAEIIYISKNSSDRAADIEEQVDVAIECGTPFYADADIVSSAKKCIAGLNPKTDMMIVTGSLYTIAELLKTNIV